MTIRFMLTIIMVLIIDNCNRKLVRHDKKNNNDKIMIMIVDNGNRKYVRNDIRKNKYNNNEKEN